MKAPKTQLVMTSVEGINQIIVQDQQKHSVENLEEKTPLIEETFFPPPSYNKILNSTLVGVRESIPGCVRRGIVRNYTVDDFNNIESAINQQGVEKTKRHKSVKNSLSHPINIHLFDQSSPISDLAPPASKKTCYRGPKGVERSSSPCCRDCKHEDEEETQACNLDECTENTDLINTDETQGSKPVSKNLHANSVPVPRTDRPPKRYEVQPPYNNKMWARKIDEYSRGTFPLLFGVFNIIYWSYYS